MIITKSNSFKRIISLLLAALCVLPFSIFTAFADGIATEKPDVYVGMINSPYFADGSAINLMDGSSINGTLGTGSGILKYYQQSGSMIPLYCVEPGKGLNTGNNLNLNEYIAKKTNNTLTENEEVSSMLGRLFLYAYTGEASDLVEPLSQYMATQILVWEITVGERDLFFNHVSNSNGGEVLDILNRMNATVANKIMGYYNSYVLQMKNHLKIPSFCNLKENSAQEYIVGSDGKVVLTDKNNVLSNFNFTTTSGSVNVSGNSLVVTVSAGSQAAITANKTVNSNKRAMFCYGTASYQNVVAVGALEIDPRNSFVKIKGLEKGTLEVIKTAEDGIVSGVEFNINGNDIDTTVKTDINGIINIPNLTAGNYTVTEVVPVRYENQQSRTVTVEPGKTATVSFANVLKKSQLIVIKKDKETGKVIAVSGIGFRIKNTSTGKFISQHINYPTSMDIGTFYTDNTGKLVLPQPLVFGKYELLEISAPQGYALDSEPIPFTVDGTESVITVEKSDIAQKGTITISKKGEIFSSVNKIGNLYQPIYENKGLANAVFNIIASEDIYTLDGTLRAKTGEVVDTVTTDIGGKAKSKQLYLGKYEIVEIKAPYGFVINKKVKYAELLYAGQEIEEAEALNVDFINDRQKVKISLKKALEQDKLFEIGSNAEYKNVLFGLYANEDITADDATVIPKDGLIATASLNDDMTAVFKADIPFGKYYVREISTDEHYILNGEKYVVTFNYQGQELSTVYLKANNGNSIENYIIRGNNEGKKIDVQTKQGLKNAVIGLFKVGTTEYTKANALQTAISDENGCFSFADIPFGEYVIREISAPVGYLLSNKNYPVSIKGQGNTVNIEIENNKEPIPDIPLEKNPKTSDTNSADLLVIFSAIAIISEVVLSRKKKNDVED